MKINQKRAQAILKCAEFVSEKKKMIKRMSLFVRVSVPVRWERFILSVSKNGLTVKNWFIMGKGLKAFSGKPLNANFVRLLLKMR